MDDKFLIEIGVQQKTILEDVKSIKEKVECLPCAVHENKISLLQKVVFGFVAIILFAWMSNLTPLSKVKAKEPAEEVKTKYEFIYPPIPGVRIISVNKAKILKVMP